MANLECLDRGCGVNRGFYAAPPVYLVETILPVPDDVNAIVGLVDFLQDVVGNALQGIAPQRQKLQAGWYQRAFRQLITSRIQ